MPLSKAERRTLAEQLLADYDAANPGTPFAQGLRLTLDEAWAVQADVADLRVKRGEQCIGYKVGCVDPGNQTMMGLNHPVWGRLWDSEVHRDGATLRRADYANLGIEAEFGVVLAKPVMPEMSVGEIVGAVDEIMPTLELHNLHFGGEKPWGAELIANNCINSGVVRGDGVRPMDLPRRTDLPRKTDLPPTTDLKLIYDDKQVDGWEDLRWPDDLLGAVPILAKALAAHGIALKAGDLLLTSAWGPPISVGDASRVTVSTSGFGSVSAEVV